MCGIWDTEQALPVSLWQRVALGEHRVAVTITGKAEATNLPRQLRRHMKSQTYQDLIKEICERFNLSHTSLKAITQAESSEVAAAIDGWPMSAKGHIHLALYIRNRLNDEQVIDAVKTAEGYLMMLQLRAREEYIKDQIKHSQRLWAWPILGLHL